jgi:hypothetical protein
MAGTTPKTADEINNLVGVHLRQFVDIQEIIFHDFSSLSGLSLTAPPFEMSASDETDIKTAINGLNTALQAVDMTFIDRLTGLF